MDPDPELDPDSMGPDRNPDSDPGGQKLPTKM